MRNVVVGLLLLGDALTSSATDKPINAVKLMLSRSASGTEKLTFVSKDVNFLFPTVGSGGDPSLYGATVTLVSPLQSPVTLTIPAGIGNPGWRVNNRPTLDTYKYTNGPAPAGPSVVRSAKLNEKKSIKIVARETGLALTAPQGSVGIRIATGAQVRNCALFDAATIIVDQPGRFVARGAIATSIADCSDAALGAPPVVPVCGNGVREGNEECDGADLPLGTPPGVQCTSSCTFCGTTDCRFPLAVDIPCCAGFGSCIILGPNGGVCSGAPSTTTSSTSTTTTTNPTCLEHGERCRGTTPCCGTDVCAGAVCGSEAASSCSSCVPDFDAAAGCITAGCTKDADCCTAGSRCVEECNSSGFGLCMPGCIPPGYPCCGDEGDVCCSGGACPAEGFCPNPP